MWESKLTELQEPDEGQRRGLWALRDNCVPLAIPQRETFPACTYWKGDGVHVGTASRTPSSVVPYALSFLPRHCKARTIEVAPTLLNKTAKK